jgi:frataxin-like iron-binding protein CyaY
VRQIWLAAASKGIAYHFNYDSGRWLDDKGKGVELLGELKKLVQEAAGVSLNL